MENYYDILGVSKDATSNQLKIAYRDLAIRWHPDKHAGESEVEKKEIEEKFKKINEAYAVLSDTNKRRDYDSYGVTKFYEHYTRDDIFRGFNYEEVITDLFSNITEIILSRGNSEEERAARRKAIINAIVDGGTLLFIYLYEANKSKGDRDSRDFR